MSPHSFSILDKHFKENKLQYFLQCMLAALTLVAILFFLDVLTRTAIIAALGSSAFTIFALPKKYSADPRRLLGGYAVGMSLGILFSVCSSTFGLLSFIESETTRLIICGSLAVGLSIFIMTMTNTEHAPAAGIALGLVLNPWDEVTLLFIVVALLWMATVRHLLKPWLINLT